MYDPFNLNDYLGPFLAAKLFLGAAFLIGFLGLYTAFLQKQEDNWRSKKTD